MLVKYIAGLPLLRGLAFVLAVLADGELARAPRVTQADVLACGALVIHSSSASPLDKLPGVHRWLGSATELSEMTLR